MKAQKFGQHQSLKHSGKVHEAVGLVTRRAKDFPSLEQVRHVIQSTPNGDPVERHDPALLAFFLLTGTRDGAAVPLKLKPGRPSKPTLFPIGDNVREIVVDWVGYLQRDPGWAPDDPLFPAEAPANAGPSASGQLQDRPQ